MNRLWDIPELVRLIFGLLDKTTRIRLAPVCRTFWLHTLPFTWECVYGLEPLLNLLPDDAVSWTHMGNREAVTLTRALQNCDWDRFILYSKHVRRFVVRLGTSTRHTHQQLLPHLPPTPILPNLTSVKLEIGEEMEPNSGLLTFLLPSSLREVDVWAGYETDMEKPGYRWMVDGLAEIELPELTSLSIVMKRSSQKIIHSICQSHLGVQTLRLEWGRGEQYLDVLRAAGQLPLLRRLEIDTGPQIWQDVAAKESEIISLPESLFLAVESLKLYGAPDFLDALLSRVSSTNVRSVRLVAGPLVRRYHEPEGHRDSALANAFRAIGRFTHLKVLDITLDVPITWDSLQHVVECKELENFRLGMEVECDFGLQESHLELMGRAWSCLTTMDLKPPNRGYVQDKGMSPAHLRVISREFRNLQKLAILLDSTKASSARVTLEDLAINACNALQELNVGKSTIGSGGEAEEVGLLFRTLWPNLRELQWEDDSTEANVHFWSAAAASLWSTKS